MTRPILFLNFTPGPPSRTERLKLDGIRRYARMLDRPVITCLGDAVRPKNLPRILDRFQPEGCIAECWYDQRVLPPRLFGSIPVVYFDAPDGPDWREAVSISCDEAAVARAAFRELAAARPPCYAVVPYFLPRRWSDARVAAFRTLCEEAEASCHVFVGRLGSNRVAREARFERLVRWMADLPPHCAIFAVNDESAFEAMRALITVGRHVPRSATLVGVDATEMYAEENPDLPGVSSVEVDFELAGYLAAKRLGDCLLAARNAKGRKGFANSASFAAKNITFGPLLVIRRKSTSGMGRHEGFILEALETIRREACEGLTVAGLAARFKCSRRLFDMRFREAMGHSVRDEIEHVRFENAFTLLKSTDKPVSSIADFCGYRTGSALRHIFLARTGMSMREWRARNRR